MKTLVVLLRLLGRGLGRTLIQHLFRLAPIPLALAVCLNSMKPAAAIDLTNFVPFQLPLSCVSEGTLCVTPLHTLPAGRETVFEYFGFICSDIPANVRMTSWSVFTVNGGVGTLAPLEVPVAAQLGLSGRAASGGQAVRLYADPGTSVDLQVIFSGIATGVSCNFTLVGEQSPSIS